MTNRSFSEGFVGAFKLAAAIVMAVCAVISAFASGTPTSDAEHHGGRAHI